MDDDKEKDDESDPSHWFIQIRDIIREFLARKIEEYIYNNEFDFDDIYFREQEPTSKYKKDIQTILETYILPNDHFFSQAKGSKLTKDDSG